MSSPKVRVIRLEQRLRPVTVPPPADPAPDPVGLMAWRIFDRARQGRLAATGARGALALRAECVRTGLPPAAERAACRLWDAEVDDEWGRLHGLGPDAWTAELRALGVDIDGILSTEWALVPADARPRPPEDS